MNLKNCSTALVAAFAFSSAMAAAAPAVDSPAMLDRSMDADKDAAVMPATTVKPAKLTPEGRAALRRSRKAMALPGPSLEVIGGPLAFAEQAFADRAYPAGSIPFARTEEAIKANGKVKNKGAGKAKGKDKPEKWKQIGPSEANFPGILAFSGADYTTSGRVTAMAIAQNLGTMMTALLPAVFAAVAPPGSMHVPVIVGAITLAVTAVAATAAWSTRETYRIRLADLGTPAAVPVDRQEYERLRSEAASA